MKKPKKWIQGAIKHPGVEKKAAKKAGMSTHEYMEKHKDSPGKAGKRARLGLRLSGMAKAGGKRKEKKTGITYSRA